MYRALFDFQPNESERADSCISINGGDLLVNVKQLPGGWSVGHNLSSRETGVVPSDYLCEGDVVTVQHDIAGRYKENKPKLPHQSPPTKKLKEIISQMRGSLKMEEKIANKEWFDDDDAPGKVIKGLESNFAVFEAKKEHDDQKKRHGITNKNSMFKEKKNLKSTFNEKLEKTLGFHKPTHSNTNNKRKVKPMEGSFSSNPTPSDPSNVQISTNIEDHDSIKTRQDSFQHLVEKIPLPNKTHDEKQEKPGQKLGQSIELSTLDHHKYSNDTAPLSFIPESPPVNESEEKKNEERTQSEMDLNPKINNMIQSKKKEGKPSCIKYSDKKFLKPVRGQRKGFKNRLMSSGRDEEFFLKAILGIIAGLLSGAILYIILVFSFDFSYEYAAWITLAFTVILCFGLALSTFFRCIAMLMIPNIFTGRGRLAIFSAIFAITLAGPAVNIAFNAQQVSNGLGCVTALAHNQSEILKQQLMEPIFQIQQQILRTINRLQEKAKAIDDALKPVKEILFKLQNAFEVAVKFLQDATNKCIPAIDEAHTKCVDGINYAKNECVHALDDVTKTIVNIGKDIGDAVSDIFKIFGKRKKRSLIGTRGKSLPYKYLSSRKSDFLTKTSTYSQSASNSSSIFKVEKASKRYRRFSLSFVCKILDIDFVCDILNIAKDICKIPRYIGNFAEIAARKTKEELNKIFDFFEVGVQGNLDVNGSINSSKTSAQILAQIKADIKNQSNRILNVTSLISQIMAITLLLIFIKSALYLRKYRTKVNFDNIFITSSFIKYDKARGKLGKSCVLPLKMREKTKYIHVTSKWLTLTEIKNVKMAGMTVFYHILITTLIILGDYGLFYLLIIINKYGKTLITAQGTARINIRVSGISIIAKFLETFGEGIQLNDTYSVDYNITVCLPQPSPPGVGNLFIISFLYIVALLFLVMQAYGSRMRNQIAAYFYPEQEFDRIRFLHNKIRHKRAKIFTWLKQYLPFRKKDEDVSERITLSAMCFYQCPKLASLCGICHPKRDVECVVCGAQEDGLIKFYKCRVPKCSGIYCEDCYKEARKNCLVCKGIDTFGSQENLMKNK